MPIEGYIALLAIAVFCAILITYLFRVITILVHVSFTLGTIIAGVRAIEDQTKTVPETIASVNSDLGPVLQKSDSLAGRVGGRRAIGSDRPT